MRAIFPKKERLLSRREITRAVRYWRHALSDDSQNPVLLLLLGQALFATGAFDEAAGATQAGMSMLPSDLWGVVVAHYRELYGNVADYTTQLRALEKSIAENRESPALHFLAGFHYGYLGFPRPAIGQLDQTITIEPHDAIAWQFREEMAARLRRQNARAAPPG